MDERARLKKAMSHLDKACELAGGVDLDSAQRSKLDSLLWAFQARIDFLEQRRWQMAKVKEYPELQQEGRIFFEQSIRTGLKLATLGVQVASDGRVWVCVDGQALIRFTPTRQKKEGRKDSNA